MAVTHLTAAQREYLRRRPAYPFLLWVTRIWIVGLAALMVLAILGVGQFAVAFFCVVCVLALMFVVARRTVEAQMLQVLAAENRSARRQLSMAIWFTALRDAFLPPK